MRMKIFLSYAHEDAAVVEQYIRVLRKNGEIEVFWDKSIPPGSSFPMVLAKALRDSTVFVLFLSKAACLSEFIVQEVTQANRTQLPIIPVALEILDADHDATGLHLLVDSLQAIPAYALDIETATQQLVAAVYRGSGKPRMQMPIIAVMGTKGGVGKSSFIKATAELIASSGHSVIIIDSDIESAGITREYTGSSHGQMVVRSTLDATYGWQEEATSPKKESDLREITPKYLIEEGDRCGKVYLVPGRLDHDTRPGYEAIANIPETKRNEAVLEILKNIIQSATISHDDIQCVLVDCGAENNPMVSAGFVIATCGFIVSGPDPRLRASIPRLNLLHKTRYPDRTINDMIVVVNQATTETKSLWGDAGGSFFVKEDTAHRLATSRGGLDFKGVGFNRYYLDVLRIMKATFRSEYQHLLPNEGEVWVKPFLEDISDLPDVVLSRPQYKFLLPITVCKILAAAVVIGLSFYYIFGSSRTMDDIVAEKEIQKPITEDNEAFIGHLSEVSIPEQLEENLWIEGTILKSKGMLPKQALEDLKSTIEYPPLKEALVELGVMNQMAVDNAQRTENMLRQISWLSSVGAVAVVVFTFLSWRKFTKRKVVLRSIMRARSQGKEDLSKLAQVLLSEETNKSHLRWLRKEWDRYASNLQAKTISPFLRRTS